MTVAIWVVAAATVSAPSLAINDAGGAAATDVTLSASGVAAIAAATLEGDIAANPLEIPVNVLLALAVAAVLVAIAVIKCWTLATGAVVKSTGVPPTALSAV